MSGPSMYAVVFEEQDGLHLVHAERTGLWNPVKQPNAYGFAVFDTIAEAEAFANRYDSMRTLYLVVPASLVLDITPIPPAEPTYKMTEKELTNA